MVRNYVYQWPIPRCRQVETAPRGGMNSSFLLMSLASMACGYQPLRVIRPLFSCHTCRGGGWLDIPLVIQRLGFLGNPHEDEQIGRSPAAHAAADGSIVTESDLGSSSWANWAVNCPARSSVLQLWRVQQSRQMTGACTSPCALFTSYITKGPLGSLLSH